MFALAGGKHQKRVSHKLIYTKNGEPIQPLYRGGCLVIGHFDGLHRGHAMLIARARQMVGDDAAVVVMGFSPHARQFFAPDKQPFLLQALPEKLQMLEAMAVDIYYELRFDKALAELAPDNFITRYVIEACEPCYVVVGKDFRFGKNRQGSVADFTKDARVKTLSVGLLQDRDLGVVSSSNIRKRLLCGDVASAASLLGRNYSIRGEVKKGDSIAAGEGVATANIEWDKDRLRIRFGVYVVRVLLEDGSRYFGVANFGLRPTFGENFEPRLEVHLFGFDGVLYAQTIEVSFLSYVRDEQKFESKEALFRQIAFDISASKQFIATHFQPGL